MAVLAAISAVATFLILSQFHSAEVSKAVHAAPPPIPRSMASVPTPATAPAAVAPPEMSARPAPPPVEEKAAAAETVRPEPAAPAADAAPEEASLTLRSKHSIALIAEDHASLDQMLSDPHTIPQLIHDGRLFSAKPGTKVEILERQHNLVHIRLLEGATADRTGWVSKSAIAGK